MEILTHDSSQPLLSRQELRLCYAITCFGLLKDFISLFRAASSVKLSQELLGGVMTVMSLMDFFPPSEVCSIWRPPGTPCGSRKPGLTVVEHQSVR